MMELTTWTIGSVPMGDGVPGVGRVEKRKSAIALFPSMDEVFWASDSRVPMDLTLREMLSVAMHSCWSKETCSLFTGYAEGQDQSLSRTSKIR